MAENNPLVLRDKIAVNTHGRFPALRRANICGQVNKKNLIASINDHLITFTFIYHESFCFDIVLNQIT